MATLDSMQPSVSFVPYSLHVAQVDYTRKDTQKWQKPETFDCGLRQLETPVIVYH